MLRFEPLKSLRDQIPLNRNRIEIRCRVQPFIIVTHRRVIPKAVLTNTASLENLKFGGWYSTLLLRTRMKKPLLCGAILFAHHMFYDAIGYFAVMCSPRQAVFREKKTAGVRKKKGVRRQNVSKKFEKHEKLPFSPFQELYVLFFLSFSSFLCPALPCPALPFRFGSASIVLVRFGLGWAGP